MKTLQSTLIAILVAAMSISCSLQPEEVKPIPAPRNDVEDQDKRNESGNTDQDPKEDQNDGCGQIIQSSELPATISNFITNTYSTKAPYYYIVKVEVCIKNGDITTYTVTLDGPHSLTLNFDKDGNRL